MSDRRWFVVRQVAFALLLGTIAARAAPAQQFAEKLERTRKLQAVWEAAERAADRADSLLAASRQLDSVRTKSITVYSLPGEVSLVAEGTRRFAAVLDSVMGDDAPRLLGSFRAFVRVSQNVERSPTALPRSVYSMRVPANGGPDDVVARLRDRVSRTLTEKSGPVLQAWGGVRAAFPSPPSLPRMYRQLLMSPSIASRRCFLGDVSWCAKAFRLVPVEDPVLELYDAGQRRLLVERRGLRYRSDPGIPEAREACVEKQLDAACLGLWRAIIPGTFPDPLGAEARASLTHAALQRGGHGAFSRWVGRPLSEGPAALADRLSVTAGEPLDSLLAAWRQGVIAHRPEPTRVPLASQWASIGWVMVLGLIAIRRTKWLSI